MMHSQTTVKRTLSSPTKPKLITLNVGGENFATTYETLTQGHAANSMLSVLASTALPTTRDPTGRIFIDRDGARFRAVLNFLRCGTVHVVQGRVSCPAGGFIVLEELEEEARFYGLQRLVDIVREQITRLQLEDFMDSLYKQRQKQACQCRPHVIRDHGDGKEEDAFRAFTLDADF